MKTSLLTLISLLLLLTVACSKPDTVLAAGELTGSWSGNTTTVQAGNCRWGSSANVATMATWQVTDNRVTATVTRVYGQVATPAPITMQGVKTGNKITLTESAFGSCNGIGRAYSIRYEGEISGKNLTMVGLDTICPVERCIFRLTMTLTRQ